MSRKSLISGFLVMVLTLLFGVTQSSLSSSALSATALQQGIPSLAPMLKSVTPAVVSIKTTRQLRLEGQAFMDDRLPEQLRRFFDFDQTLPAPGRDQLPIRQGAGSGVIIDAQQGFIVTNHHVVDEADDIAITLEDGRTFSAQLLGSDAGTDVALLQISANDLQALEFSDSDSARIGDFVVAIGNPFGIGQTVTAGIISALGRSGLDNDRYEDFIQTDAAINVGNSGGALVDMQGRLVGINAAIISSNGGGSDGIGFAVPSNMVAKVVDLLKRDGEVRRGLLGVQISDNSPQLAQSLSLGSSRGALVTQVLPDSAAEAAGVQVFDVITGIEGQPIGSGRDLRNFVALVRQGETVELDVLRGDLQLTLGAIIRGTGDEPSSGVKTPELPAFFAGASLQTATENGVPVGVKVADVDQRSRAGRSGLQANDIITEVNRQSVDTLQEFERLLGGSDDLLVLTILRDGRPQIIRVN